MSKQANPKVNIIVKQADVEARNLDDIKVKPEHIVLSILTDNDNQCVDVLRNLGVNSLALYDIISEFIRKNDLLPRINVDRKILPLSEETKKIIKSLDEECEKSKDKIINPTHLMLAILSTDLPIVNLLKEFGISYNSFNNKIKDMKNNFKSSHLDDEFEEQNEMDRMRRMKKKGDVTKTTVLDNFCRDVTKAVERGDIDPIVGRGNEIKRVSQILSRRKKNNPILIGEPGVGKTAIIEGLASLIKDGNAPRTLLNKKIYALDLATVVAGTKYRGQFEERMKAILEECKSNPNIILFIDEIHTIVGAGNASGSLDASNIFKPALARGELQVIGATTLNEYRENIEKDGALTRRFQQVLVIEPTIEETKIILNNIKEKYEKHHKVEYTPEAIDECVKLSARYIMERSMPDKAIDVMDEAGAATNVIIDKPDNIKELEIIKTDINNKKKEVVLKQKYEEAAKLRDQEKKITEQLEKAILDWKEKLDKHTSIVDVANITEVISIMTGIPLTKISVQESKRLVNMDKDLMNKIIGQDDAIIKVVKAIKRNRIGIKDKNKPVGSFIFLGPTGVGKCFLSDTEIVIKDKKTNLEEKITINKLIERIKH